MATDSLDTPPTTTARLVLAADVGPIVRTVAFDEADHLLRLSAVGEAIATAGSPDFDAGRGIAAALADLDARLGVYAGDALPPPAAVTGSNIGAALPAFVFTDLPEQEQIQLDALLRAHGFTLASRVETGSRRLLDRHDPEDLAAQILNARTQLIVLALRSDSGGESLAAFAEIVRFAVRGRVAGYSPGIAVLYGESPDQSLLTGLGEAFATRLVDIRGAGDSVNIAAAGSALADLYQGLILETAFRGTRPEGLQAARVVPLNAALGWAARNLVGSNDLTVAVVHVEAPGAMIVLCERGTVRTGAFGYQRAGAAVEHIGLELDLEEILRWMPFDATVGTAGSYFMNRAARPWTTPETPTEAALEHAASHLALRRAIENLGKELPALDLIVCTGRNLGDTPHPVQAALVAINACQPGGYCQIALDRSGALAAEGALQSVGVELEPGGGLVHVGTVVAAVGEDSPGRAALAVEVRTEDGKPIQRQVNFGAMDRIMWEPGNLGTVRAWPSGKLDVGGGRGRATTLRTRIEPGCGGLIIDARGRPIAWPEEGARRRAAVLQWAQSTESRSVPSPARVIR
ncbi:MAG: hypothetical protein QF719_11685 [Chloroflexota bacterium]|jgi:hypothetical protein|nr:hypothetical protein [Chloroflexota bacterium]